MLWAYFPDFWRDLRLLACAPSTTTLSASATPRPQAGELNDDEIQARIDAAQQDEEEKKRKKSAGHRKELRGLRVVLQRALRKVGLYCLFSAF